MQVSYTRFEMRKFNILPTFSLENKQISMKLVYSFHVPKSVAVKMVRVTVVHRARAVDQDKWTNREGAAASGQVAAVANRHLGVLLIQTDQTAVRNEWKIWRRESRKY